jgi:hypothetical protein
MHCSGSAGSLSLCAHYQSLGLPWPALACLGLPWPALACLGLPWPALACLGLPWPALACLDLPWPALACPNLVPILAYLGLGWLFRPALVGFGLPLY